jgi:hypothetical protein
MMGEGRFVAPRTVEVAFNDGPYETDSYPNLRSIRFGPRGGLQHVQCSTAFDQPARIESFKPLRFDLGAMRQLR